MLWNKSCTAWCSDQNSGRCTRIVRSCQSSHQLHLDFINLRSQNTSSVDVTNDDNDERNKQQKAVNNHFYEFGVRLAEFTNPTMKPDQQQLEEFEFPVTHRDFAPFTKLSLKIPQDRKHVSTPGMYLCLSSSKGSI